MTYLSLPVEHAAELADTFEYRRRIGEINN